MNKYDLYCFQYFGFSATSSSSSCSVEDSYRCSQGDQEKCIKGEWKLYNDCSTINPNGPFIGCSEGECIKGGVLQSNKRLSDTTCNLGQDCYVNQGDTVDVNGNKINLINVNQYGSITVKVDKTQTINSNGIISFSEVKIRNKQVVYNPSANNLAATIVVTN